MRTIILLLIISMTSCVGLKPSNGVYDLSLKDNDKGNVEGLKFSDDVIDISWSLTAKSLHFELYNKTQNPIKVIWDDVIFVDYEGKSNKVVHEGILYINAHDTQPPSTIAGGSHIIDRIIPSDNITFVSGYNSYWREANILPNGHYSTEQIKMFREDMINKEIKILMPIEVEGKVTNYTFAFNIDNFRISN